MPRDNEVELKIASLKKKFVHIKKHSEDITHIFDTLDAKIAKLKEIYKGFLQDNKHTLFIFGLDSFKFQNRLLDEEYLSLRKFYNLICNRIYCDHYKLYGIICEYVTKTKDISKLHNLIHKDKYERYDYLKVYKYYEISKSADIFSEIMMLVNAINDCSKQLDAQIHSYELKKKNGLNINNFVYTLKYKNSLLKEQIHLYLNYLSFFIKLHSKYLTRFITRIKIMFTQVNHDIIFDDSGHSREKRQEMVMQRMKSHIDVEKDEDKLLVNEIIQSLDGEGGRDLSDGSSREGSVIVSPLRTDDDIYSMSDDEKEIVRATRSSPHVMFREDITLDIPLSKQDESIYDFPAAEEEKEFMYENTGLYKHKRSGSNDTCEMAVQNIIGEMVDEAIGNALENTEQTMEGEEKSIVEDGDETGE